MLARPIRFYSLDALRGFAALSIVFWHWQNFFCMGTAPASYSMAVQPMYSVLFLFYKKGHLAVDLFFSLSGFIFYWLYSGAISLHKISPVKFAILRFSRLYPLHFATLIAVASEQMYLHNKLGSSFVYANNDLYHFALNMLFISTWGLQKGLSFNGPIWSVSIEIILYVAFFLVCSILPKKSVYLPIIVLLGFSLELVSTQPVIRGLSSFFVGGSIYCLYMNTLQLRKIKLIAYMSFFTTILLWITTFLIVSNTLNLGSYYIYRHLMKHELIWPAFVLFPSTIYTLAILETQRGTLCKRISFIGDITYSSYLLHFPLQLAFIGIAGVMSVDNTVFYSPYVMALFFFLLISGSFISYRYFEMPMQSLLRKLLLAPKTLSSQAIPNPLTAAIIPEG